MRSNKNRATRFLLRRNLFIGVTVFLVAFYMLPFWHCPVSLVKSCLRRNL